MNAFLNPAVPRLLLARVSLMGLVLFGATAARATPTFPGVIRSDLSLSAAPQCGVCHQGAPAVGTVTTPFGASLRTRGLAIYNEESLHKSLSALAAEHVDSDGDGTPDTEELKAGRDPNKSDAPTAPGTDPRPVIDSPPEPTYGCGAAPGAPVLGFMVLGALGLWRGRRRA